MVIDSQLAAAFHAAFPQDDRTLVFGEGPETTPALMLIGEAPGREETEQQRPFVGKAGKNLNEFLATIGLNRADIRISNTVKVRPTKVSLKGTVSNRPPNRAELNFFAPWLREEILSVRPKLIVTLGNTPLQALLGKEITIGTCHGRSIDAAINEEPFPLFPLYHPASIIYNRSLKEVYEADMVALRDLLLKA